MRLDSTLQTAKFVKKHIVTSHELIELIEQEGATRFFGKIWGDFGAFWTDSTPNFSNLAVAKAGLLSE
jgi:hypothetical protein